MRFFFIQDTNKGVVSGQEPLSLKLSMAGFLLSMKPCWHFREKPILLVVSPLLF